MWGATAGLNATIDFAKISIHAPVWGATFLEHQIKQAVDVFQFTLPCGERLKIINKLIINLLISIHAPVWGATIILI